MCLFHSTPLRSIFSFLHPTPASHLAQIITPPGLWASYTTFAEMRSPLKNLFPPTVVGSAANMASPLPLQLANPVGYVDGYLGSLPDHLMPFTPSFLMRSLRKAPSIDLSIARRVTLSL
ncbi:unnamed protein product [Arctia plantaginis]|uniref:Uncharacterized protein n=1 Tax=Arctia plantaginis TaxID=874455 RepID=A0A8S1AVB0_ARCPL|nr:unnamed protein product [Arctia plantaginis]